MSGLVNPFTPPHGDALLQREIKEVPNRTGGGMTCYRDVRDALCNLREGAYGNVGMGGKGPRALTDAAAYAIAASIVNFGRACYYAGIDDDSGRPNSDRGVTAGVAAMMEES